MAGKQLEKVLKSIECQLFKLVLSHAFKLWRPRGAWAICIVRGKKDIKKLMEPLPNLGESPGATVENKI